MLGTSQGGWIAARMAMLAPGTVKGIMPLGTSMDFESQRSRDLGCWDGISFCTPAIDALAESVDDDWVIPVEGLIDAVEGGPGRGCAPRSAHSGMRHTRVTTPVMRGGQRLADQHYQSARSGRSARSAGQREMSGLADALHRGPRVLGGQRRGRDQPVRQMFLAAVLREPSNFARVAIELT